MSDFERDFRDAVRDIGGRVISAYDQARAMTDVELGKLLLSGHWTTIEVNEAGRRLAAREEAP